MTKLPDRPPLFASMPQWMDLPRPGVDGATWFPSADLARDAIREYAYRVAQLNAERDPLLRGAIAAGVSVSEIQAVTGVARTTTNRIEPRPVAEPVEEGTLLTYARLLSHRANRLTTVAAACSDEREQHYLGGYCQVTRDEANGWLSGDPSFTSPYGDRVLHRANQLEALAFRDRDYGAYPSRYLDGPQGMQVRRADHGKRMARDRIAHELRLLRGGISPVLMFTREDVEAFEASPDTP